MRRPLWVGLITFEIQFVKGNHFDLALQSLRIAYRNQPDSCFGAVVLQSGGFFRILSMFGEFTECPDSSRLAIG